MSRRRERFHPDQRFRGVTGSVFTIKADWHYHPAQEQFAKAEANGLMFYTVTHEDGHESVLEHGVIDGTCTPLPSEGGTQG